MNRSVLVLTDDLFWRSKIEHAVRSAQREVEFAADPAALAECADPAKHCLILVDLALRKPPFEAVEALKKDAARAAIPVVGYYEHVRKDLKQRAEASGFDQVLLRSTFAEKLADLVFAYALPGAARVAPDEPELPEE